MSLQLKDFVYVIIQFILFGIFLLNYNLIEFELPVYLKATSIIITILGVMILALSILQLNKNLSPFPTPKSNSELITTGLYKHIRHPIYTGILVMFLGYSVYSTSVFKLLVTLLLFILFIIKSTYEEKKLCLKFDAYRTYSKATGRFFPKLF